MGFDIFYLLGLLVIWWGNIEQILKLRRTRSTKSISLRWPIAIFISISIRLPRAFFSEYWVWGYGYLISFILCLILLCFALYYRKKYPRR